MTLRSQPMMTRRAFAATLMAGLAAPRVALAQDRVVVVGGGPAGTGLAWRLAQQRPRGAVVLIERDPTRFVPASGPFLRPGAGVSVTDLDRAGVDLVLDEIAQVDWRAARVLAQSGRHLAFDRLVLAPGTAAVRETLPGLTAHARHMWPAAWGARREAQRLAGQIAGLAPGAHLVLRLPAMLSHPEIAQARAIALARMAPQARLTVLQDQDDPGLRDRVGTVLAGQGLAAPDWHLAGQGGRILSIDAPTGLIETEAGGLRADVVNFVPPHAAGPVARAAGLVDSSGWCPVDAQNRSRLRPQVLVLGDARQGAQRMLPTLV